METKTKLPEKKNKLPKSLLVQMYEQMLESRLLEERLIKIYKSGGGYFWIGGPGEEAFGVPLGHLIKKGHDYLHPHYRCTPTMVALGMDTKESIRMMMNKATDTHSGGRNFVNHYCNKKWNVMPVTSTIGVQYSIAIGTAWIQRRSSSDDITVVTGGDAGTAEGDFATCLIWSSRPKKELPILITVQNNNWGISTHYSEQHSEKNIADRGKCFGIKTCVIDSMDPEETYLKLKELFSYVRTQRKPALVEIKVSRLYGHSSASGANFINEPDPLKMFEQKLLKLDIIKESQVTKLYKEINKKLILETKSIVADPDPSPASIWDSIYYKNENADWRKF